MSELARIIGPCYTRSSFARVLEVSEDVIDQMTASLEVLALTTADGEVVFPAFQLHQGKPFPEMPDILRFLSKGIDDPWTWSLWLIGTPAWSIPAGSPPRTHIESLIIGHGGAVIMAARHTSVAWRR